MLDDRVLQSKLKSLAISPSKVVGKGLKRTQTYSDLTFLVFFFFFFSNFFDLSYIHLCNSEVFSGTVFNSFHTYMTVTERFLKANRRSSSMSKSLQSVVVCINFLTEVW